MIHRNNTPTWYYSENVGIAWVANKEAGYPTTSMGKTQMWGRREFYTKYWMLKLI